MSRKKMAISLSLVTVIAVAAVLIVQNRYFPTIRYDSDDPDYVWIAEKLASAASETNTNRTLDFSLLTDQSWKAACLFGGYTDPQKTVLESGGVISKQDRRRFARLNSSILRISPVEEFEAMVVFIRADRTSNFIHFPLIYGPKGQHFESCVEKPDTILNF